jgi:V/A-type H+/Na+-transporting ATPase subunit D
MSARPRGMPQGRSARVWLKRRLAVARRGADLLDQKLRILRREEQRFTLFAERTGAAWEQAAREAETWLLRGVLLSGERGVRLADEAAAAEVDVRWVTTMGVRHPDSAVCTRPVRSERLPLADNAALVRAVNAYGKSLDAAVEHAAALAALHALEAEIRATRRRSRALEDRWIPRLETALRQVQLALDEQEHDDGVRRRWASAHAVGTRRPPEEAP